MTLGLILIAIGLLSILFLIAGCETKSVGKKSNLDEKQEIQTLRGHGGDVESVASSPDGSLLPTESLDDTAKLGYIP